ncbi:MAG: MobF family relaxase [Acidimicrobiia bacterium]
MLSLAKAHKDYYLQKLGEITPREDYYLRGGTATGRWHGSGAIELGLGGTVSAEGLVRLFDGQHPATGEQLGRRIRKDGVAAWDLTFSADKSVSLLWAFGGPDVRRHVVEAFEEAAAEALSYLESVASSTRGATRTPVLDESGRPVGNEDGTPRYRVETWPIRTTGYLAAWFTEFTSRADDPQLHTHVVVGNRVKGVDGVWRALDGRLLYRHKLAAGYIHEAELRSRLTRRLGVRWQPVEKGMADIVGFTREQIMAFSQRRREIEAWRREKDFADTPAAHEVAALATRSPKRDGQLGELLAQWQERAAEVGLTPEVVARTLDRGREVTVPDPEPLFDRLVSERGLTAEVSTFGRADVIKEAAGALPEGGTRQHVEALADACLRAKEVIPILPYQPVGHRVDLPIALADEERRELDDLLDSMTSSPSMRRRDGGLFPGLIHERRYTTTELLAIEQRMVDRAQTGLGAGRWTAPHSQVETTLRTHPTLTEGQRALVRQVATSGNAIDVGVGAAGTGKSTVMGIIANLATHTGTPILGTALAARAAAGFQAATRIPSTTLTRLLGEAQDGGGLAMGSIVVLDEAGMVGTRQLARLSDLVEEASGKLVLIGDHRQLAEIDAGGLFRALAHQLPAVELTENVRQTHDWERTALTELRDGSVSRAIAMYHRRQRIVTAATTEETIDQAVANWYQDVEAVGDPSQVLLLAHHNATVDRLNHQARSAMNATGYLHGPTLQSGERAFQAGDRVVCLTNRSRLGVLNGDLGTITNVDTERRAITIQLDRTGDSRTVPHWYLDDGHLDYGYALTGHKAQGATARRVHTMAGDGVEREWVYVTMSRGQETNAIYLVGPDLSEEQCSHLPHQQVTDLGALVAALGQTDAQTAAIDTGRGPETLTDAQLDQRRQALKAALVARNAAGHRRGDIPRDTCDELVEYLTLKREAEARHRDRLAAIAYHPPSWIADTLGERPAEPRRAAAWDRIVDLTFRHRSQYGIADDSPDPLGPAPPSPKLPRRGRDSRLIPHAPLEVSVLALSDLMGTRAGEEWGLRGAQRPAVGPRWVGPAA